MGRITLDMTSLANQEDDPRYCCQCLGTKPEKIQELFRDLRGLQQVTVQLENAKTRWPEDWDKIKVQLERARLRRQTTASDVEAPVAPSPSQEEAKANIQETNAAVQRAIRKAMGPAIDLLKVEHLFVLLPKLSFEYIIFRLLF